MRHARRAEAHLTARDPRLGALVDRVGPLRLRPPRGSAFEYLCRAIVYQQLSVKAAATIHGRLAAQCGGVIEPGTLSRLSETALRTAGISAQKARYLRDLTDRTLAGSLALESLPRQRDDAVIKHLTDVKGIGRWTADMFLIFFLRRPDVLPTGDLGIRKAVRNLYSLRRLPEPGQLEKIAEPWRPYRTAACWYLWRSLDGDAAI